MFPDVDPEAADEAMMVKANLGMYGRCRLLMGAFVCKVGIMLMPPELKRAAANQRVVSDRSEE